MLRVLMRKVLFWLHLTAGVLAGIVVFIMCVTGVLLMYEKQVVTWVDGYRLAAPGGPTLGPEALLRAATAAKPGSRPQSVLVRADPFAPAEVGFGRDGTLFLDPSTGAVLGSGSTSVRAFFRSVEDWHRWLSAGNENRDTARSLTGASNLAFLFIVLSGPFLWWPRVVSRQAFRAVAWFKGGLSGKARDFNWHHVLGIWSFLPLAVIVLSAVPMSYRWGSDLAYRLFGETPPPRPAPPAAPAGRPADGTRPTTPSFAGLDALWARAAAHRPLWSSLTLRLPSSDEAPVAFSIDEAKGAIRPDLRSTLTLKRTGEIAKFEDFPSFPKGRQVTGWTRFLHTGEVLGLAGQTVAGLASAAGAVLAWTGFALAWRRFVAWRARQA